jgi:glycosyltransferase involved in cell wall biosynthesis
MISVVTPCKDVISEGREPFFRKMIRTLYSQSYSNFEHIVVDSDSRDGTRKMLEEYKDEGKIDVLISKKDNNVHEAMNKGIKIAKGEYIHVMNSDNYFTNNDFFSLSLNAIEKLGVDYTHADRSVVRRDGGPTTIKKGDERAAFFRMPFRFQTMLIRKAVYDEIGPFDEKYKIAADFKFMMKMLLKGKKGHYFPEVFICSLDGGITRDRQKCIDEVTLALYEVYGKEYGLTMGDCKNIYLRKISPELYSKICANVNNNQIRNSLDYCYTNCNEYKK